MIVLARALAVIAMAALSAAPPEPRSLVAERVMSLTRESVWKRVGTVPVDFGAHHPQGMVKIGDIFYVSAVEVTQPTKRFERPANGLDRDAGQGIGHLFKIDAAGHLLADLPLGEGSVYHPGGIDYDGTNIWVPVAEYRPNSRSIVYRVNPVTMTAREAFRFADHIGALVRDTGDGSLHGVSWGSRKFYRWRLDGRGHLADAGATPARLAIPNPSHYLDYQDCKFAGRHRMLCTGVTEMRPAPGAPPFRLGGIDLIDLEHHRPIHQVPVLLWAPSGLDMTHNPVWIEPAASGLRAYFMPDDGKSTIFVYDVQ